MLLQTQSNAVYWCSPTSFSVLTITSFAPCADFRHEQSWHLVAANKPAVPGVSWFETPSNKRILDHEPSPEIMLQFEARRGDDGRYAWRYAPSRMSSRECELRYDQKLIWRVPQTIKERPSDPYYNWVLR
jgi:hypothetical protein